jgi:hypothetical protein
MKAAKIGLGTIASKASSTGEIATVLLDIIGDIDRREWLDFMDLWGIPADAVNDPWAEWWDHDPHTLDVVDAALEWIEYEAPPLCYVGAHPADKSNIGVWPSDRYIEESVRSGDTLRVAAGTDWGDMADGYFYVLEAADDGSMALYVRDWDLNLTVSWEVGHD